MCTSDRELRSSWRKLAVLLCGMRGKVWGDSTHEMDKFCSRCISCAMQLLQVKTSISFPGRGQLVLTHRTGAINCRRPRRSHRRQSHDFQVPLVSQCFFTILCLQSSYTDVVCSRIARHFFTPPSLHPSSSTDRFSTATTASTPHSTMVIYDL